MFAVDELKKAKCCEKLEQVFHKYEFIHVERSDSVSAQQLEPSFVGVFIKVRDNKLSQALYVPNWHYVYVVCSRKSTNTEMTRG